MRQLPFPAIVLGTVLLCLPAQAAKTVFGDSDAQKCYESARFHVSSSGKAACDRALRNRGLSRRDRAATLVNRGILLNHQKRADDAIDDFNSALRINATLGEAYLNRGNSEFFRKRIKAAVADYNRAIRHNSPELHAAYFNRGLAHEVLGEIAKARSDYEKVLELKPGFSPAQARLSELPRGSTSVRPRHAPSSGRS